MTEKTKQQHYVPRVYLKRFCYDDCHINVFDKVKREIRKHQSIEAVAAERFFYDVDLNALFQKMTDEQVCEFRRLFPDINVQELDEQYIEHRFSNTIESAYESIIGQFIDRAERKTKWELNNCYAFSQTDQLEIAMYAAIQMLRSKNFRELICDTKKATGKFLTEFAHQKFDLPDDVEVIFPEDKNVDKLLHGEILLDENVLRDAMFTLCTHYWVMLFNVTSIPFYTSDNPIALLPRAKHSGIKSYGIELFFPLSPKIAVVMFEKTFHQYISSRDKNYLVISDQEIVKEYNVAELRCSYRNIFTASDDLSLCEKACTKDPRISERRRLEMYFGGKKIY